ncbi:MAG: DMT family transporter [Clostridia bacterium]|jgi:drug/metabolite transporter (DMT)-like permease|nr:DMT family transporter [Clostridia bacterium]MBQ3650821.1 DMT family transporter [Clostridia bacterium]MBQ7754632.1 DMT family transporter [Clostridia bacterium]MBR0421480.1 DMT family transporter [Clostridia bacterium]
MSKRSARLLLVFVFISRGTSFLFSKTLLETLSPLDVLAVRFLLAFLIVSLVFHKKLGHASRASLRGGLILGVLCTAVMILEMFGLRLIDSGVSALIENMAIILVPVFMAIITRTRPRKKTILCAALAVIGVGFLSLTQTQNPGGGLGMLLIILAALAYSVFIIVTEKVTQQADPLTVGIVQIGTTGALSLAASFLLSGGLRLPHTSSEWILMLLLVFLCSCFGFAFQPVGQKHLPAEEAAVLTVINPLTASVLGIAVAGESLNLSKMIGYILILTALILYTCKTRQTVSAE